MNFFPLWTPRVWPIKSGMMVERRDQVRTTFFSFLAFMSETFLARWSSINGPFLSDLLIESSPLLLGLSAHDPLIRSLVVASFETTRRLAPGCHWMPPARGFALAAAVGVIHRIHRDAAIVRALPEPARFTRFAVRFVFM